MTYGIWLSWNNQQEGFELPILPGEISVNGKGDGAGYDVYKLGKINVIKDRNLNEYTIESLFPAQRYPFVTADILLTPASYVNYLTDWWATKQPIRFTYQGATMEINVAASIEAFEWKEVAGESGDIRFKLQLKEYRFYAARRAQVLQPANSTQLALHKAAPKRPNDRQTPKTYTLRAGDTLWQVAKSQLGNGDRWPEIQKLNGITNAQLKTLQIGRVLKLP